MAPVSGRPGTGGAAIEEPVCKGAAGGIPAAGDPDTGADSGGDGGLTGASTGGDTPGIVPGGGIPDGEKGAANCATAGVNAPRIRNPASASIRLSFIFVSI